MIPEIVTFLGPIFSGHIFLVFLRIGAVFLFLPIFGDTVISMRIRLGLALVVTYIVAPLVPFSQEIYLSRSSFVLAAISEVVAGLLFGFSFRATFIVVQVAGSMAAQAISLSQILGNSVEQPSTALSQILYVAALALAAILNFHVLVVTFLVKSFDIIGLGQVASGPTIEALGVETVARVFYIAFGLAGPFLIIAVLYNLCLGIVNKAMPQLMVAFIGAPAVTWMGLLLVMISGPVILHTWKDHLLSMSIIFGLP